MSSIVDSRRSFPGSHLPPRNRFADSSDEEEDEEERRLREEEEEERLLSEQHGEADEARAPKRQTDQEIEAEYGSAARARKKPRPTLTPAGLIGSKGLIRIRCEFKKTVRWPSNRRKEDAAAVYSRSLVKAYKSCCYDLFPGSAFEDMLTRIESFGSKKEVKTYLQGMRDDIRNNHLEKIYGKEKANAMIQELEHGLKQQEEMDYGNDDAVMNDASALSTRGVNDGSHAAVITGSSDNEPGIQVLHSTRAQVALAAYSEATQNQNSNETSAGEGKAAESEAEQEFDELQDTDDELEIVAPRKTLNATVSLKSAPTMNPFESDDEEEHEKPHDKVLDEPVKGPHGGLKTNATFEEAPEAITDDAEQASARASELVSEEAEEAEVSMAAATSNDKKDSEVDDAEATVEGDVTSNMQATSQESEVNSEDKEREEMSNEPTPQEQLSTPQEESSPSESSQQEQEGALASNETATLVPTMSTMGTQLEISQEGEASGVDETSTGPIAQQEPWTPHKEISSPASSQADVEDPLTSDETATLIPTMSTMRTQLDSPEQEESAYRDEAVPSQTQTIEEMRKSPTAGTQLSEAETLIPTMTANSEHETGSTESP